MLNIVVVDYGAGNLFSIKEGLEKVGANVIVEKIPEIKFKKADAIVLPGVGAFSAAMNNLVEIKSKLTDEVKQGKLVLGICLGFQLLFSKSYEVKLTAGLNLTKGIVTQLSAQEKLPHIGWNTIKIVKESMLLEGIPDNSYLYFSHSFIVNPKHKEVVIARTEYGQSFPAAIEKHNLFGTQFHPEKSSKLGMKIMRNFIEIVRR